MRYDMDKVLTERPRDSKYAHKAKGRFPRDIEDLPKFEGMERPYINSNKSFTDFLRPFEGYFRKQIGRRWDDVYSEICKTVKKDSMSHLHLHSHVKDFVELHVKMVNGVPHHKAGARWRIDCYIGGDQLYVNPEDGLIYLTPKAPKKGPTEFEKKLTARYRKLSETLQLHKVKGIWYEVQVEPLHRNKYGDLVRSNQNPVIRSYSERDAVLGSLYFLNYNKLYDLYQGYYLGVSKRQLTTRELRSHGLTND